MDSSRLEDVLDGLISADAVLFDSFPLADFEALLDGTPRYRNYSFRTEDVSAWWTAIANRGGEAAIALYNRALLLHLISRFEARAAGKCYPASILDLFDGEFERILSRVERGEESRFAVENDLFQKDLGLCRQVLFPVGNSLYEESGLPRNLLWKGGLWQFFRYAWFLLVVGHGRRPWYEGHVHLDATNLDFSSRAREDVRYRIAEMLRVNEGVRGMMGSAWLYDPALADISPKMMEARRALEQAHGWFFYVGVDHSGSALAKSPTRRRLYEDGKYTPKVYMLAWPRSAMLGWAARSVSENDKAVAD